MTDRGATKKNFTLSLDPSVVEEVDKARGLVPRSTWIEDRLKKALVQEGGS